MGVCERITGARPRRDDRARDCRREIQSNPKVIEAYLGEKYARTHAARSPPPEGQTGEGARGLHAARAHVARRALRRHPRAARGLLPRGRRARSSRSSAPTARARPPRCAPSAGCSSPAAATSATTARTIAGLKPHRLVRARASAHAPEGRGIFANLTVAREPRARRVPAPRHARASPRTRSAGSRSFPASRSAPRRWRARSPAASSRCWPSRAR